MLRKIFYNQTITLRFQTYWWAEHKNIHRQNWNFFIKLSSTHKGNFLKYKTYSTYSSQKIQENHITQDYMLYTNIKRTKLSNLETSEINRFSNTQNLLKDQTKINKSSLNLQSIYPNYLFDPYMNFYPLFKGFIN